MEYDRMRDNLRGRTSEALKAIAIKALDTQDALHQKSREHFVGHQGRMRLQRGVNNTRIVYGEVYGVITEQARAREQARWR